jgi:D-alanyl-D-alanine carboxypeptidase
MMLACNKTEIGPTVNCTTDYNDSSSKHPKGPAYQAILNSFTAKGLPGIVLLIHDKDGMWVGSSGKADIDQNIDIKPCSVSKLASVTKMYIGVVIMKLMEQGKIDLDAKVGAYLSDDLIGDIKNAKESTVRQLMNHTSGIFDLITSTSFYLQVLNDPAKKWQPEELLKFAEKTDPYFAVGTGNHYSNTNFLLLSMIIDKVAGRNHSALVREMIFEPLGLKHTYYYWHDPLPENTVQGYFDLYNNGTICNVTNYNTGSGNGYGGIYSTVHDQMIFIEALVKNKTLLSQGSLDKMMTFIMPEEEGTHRLLGLAIYKDFIDRADSTEFSYGHRGRDLAYSFDLDYFPKNQTTMSLLVNYGTDGNSSLRPFFYDLRLAVVDEIFK